jgi:hypothetical protein
VRALFAALWIAVPWGLVPSIATAEDGLYEQVRDVSDLSDPIQFASEKEPAGAAGELTGDERELIGVFLPMARLTRPAGMFFKIVVLTDPGGDESPALLSYWAGTCTLILQLRGSSLYPALLGKHDGFPRKAKLRAILAHEIGHCFQYTQADRLAVEEGRPPIMKDERSENQKHEDEVRADLFALAWAAVYEPQEFGDVYGFLCELRFQVARDESRYASREELARGLIFKPASGAASPRLLESVVTAGASLRSATLVGTGSTAHPLPDSARATFPGGSQSNALMAR